MYLETGLREITPRQRPVEEVSETSILMCPSDYFNVEYEINPWMDRHRRVDKALSRRQWDTLYRVLTEEIGVTVELIGPVKGLPDLVFTANAGLCIDQTFVASSFRHQERTREEPYWRSWFASRHYEVVRLPPGLNFEGEGDMFIHGDSIIAGYKFRSELDAVYYVGEVLDKDVVALELADPWYYHLDTCFCSISENTAIYYPGAFTEAGLMSIRDSFPNAIPVEPEEAQRFVCNSIAIGNHVVTSCDCPIASKELAARGFTVHEVRVGEFLKAGGGAKCLVLFL